MTLKRLIAAKALELMQLLEHCEDADYIDAVVDAVKYCDYAELKRLEQDGGETDEN